MSKESARSPIRNCGIGEVADSLRRGSTLPARVSEYLHHVPRVGGTRLAPNFPEVDAQRLENDLPRSCAACSVCGCAGNRCSGRLEVHPFVTSRSLCRRRARARARSPSRPPPNPPNLSRHHKHLPSALQGAWRPTLPPHYSASSAPRLPPAGKASSDDCSARPPTR